MRGLALLMIQAGKTGSTYESDWEEVRGLAPLTNQAGREVGGGRLPSRDRLGGKGSTGSPHETGWEGGGGLALLTSQVRREEDYWLPSRARLRGKGVAPFAS